MGSISDTPPSCLPPAIKEYNIRIVPWNQQELMKAIEQEAKKNQ